MNQDFHRIKSVCPGQWLYLMDDGGVVFSETQNRFAGLDAAGVAAYRAFDAGAELENLRAYHDAGGPSSPSGTAEDGLEAIRALVHGVFPGEDARPEWPAAEHSGDANIDLHGIPVFLEYPVGALEDLCLDYFRNCPTTAQRARCHLQAQHEKDGWTIRMNGRTLMSQLRDEQIGLGLLHAARTLLYAEAEYDVAFHAAMVADNGCGVMLCAPREAGKSTLTAHLVARGFDLLTDEPALLHVETGSVSPLPLPVSLKEGSWAALRPEWPQLDEAPVHVRSDGVKIRLLHPPRARFSAQPCRLTHIVFPEYSPSSVERVERLPPLRALGLLNEGGMLPAERLGRDKFEALLELLLDTPAYAIRYASLEKAEQIVHELTAQD